MLQRSKTGSVRASRVAKCRDLLRRTIDDSPYVGCSSAKRLRLLQLSIVAFRYRQVPLSLSMVSLAELRIAHNDVMYPIL